MLKKLPVGIQSIKEVIEGDYVYVDKTAHVLKLINEGKYYFMSRPRRFGKSLFVSTLEEVFKGNRKLFSSCDIAKSSYDWTPHPVIHIDFSQTSNQTSKTFKQSLERILREIAKTHGKEIEIPTLPEGLANLVKALSVSGKVVILVDEYDKPILDHLEDTKTADENRNLLRSLFGTLKGLDPYLKFVFTTGISKFSQVSLFSGLNNLDDITITAQFATMMGYTERELELFFCDHIDKIAQEKHTSPSKILSTIKEWYNGYCFFPNSTKVYNPFSTLSYLKYGTEQSYWYRTGTPAFLIEQIKKKFPSTLDLSGSKMKHTQLADIQSIDKIDLRALMWQTGYLTLKNYDSSTALYELDFPNREVREAFFDSLLIEFDESFPSEIATHAKTTKKNLLDCNFQAFFDRIKTFFAKIPYHLSSKGNEGFYHAVFLSLLEGMGLKTSAEDVTNLGRVDLVVETDKTTFIFELKINKNAEVALLQTELKCYAEKYCHQSKQLALIGVNFDTNYRNISDWRGKLFSTEGKLLTGLIPRKTNPLVS